MSEGFIFSTLFLGENSFPLKIIVSHTQSHGKNTTGLLNMDEPHIMLNERSEVIAYALYDSIYLKFKSTHNPPTLKYPCKNLVLSAQSSNG